MWKFIAGLAGAVLGTSACLASELTALESRWLQGAWPVVAFAKAAGMPLDITVQPQPTPGLTPLAMAFVDGRCKLVLSMRGNDEAQATLDRIEPGLLDEAIELMAAHELGHCKRYLDGLWQQLPKGFTSGDAATPGARPRDDPAGVKAQRREEGFADLVGLAWIQRQHPARYAQLHAWLAAERSRDLVPGSEHDTLAWVRLAGDGKSLDRPSIFSGAAALWSAGLTPGD